MKMASPRLKRFCRNSHAILVVGQPIDRLSAQNQEGNGAIVFAVACFVLSRRRPVPRHDGATIRTSAARPGQRRYSNQSTSEETVATHV